MGYGVRSCIPSSCLCFKKVDIRHNIAKKVEKVKAKLGSIFTEKDRFNFVINSRPTDPSRASWRVQSTSLIDLEEVCGRHFERENLVTKLVAEGGSGEELGIRVLSIVGVGGLGKTTLAKLAYNDSRVDKYFELRIWICVSDSSDDVGIAKGIIESVTKENSPITNQLEVLLQRLKETISGKKFLLVLDDVWAETDTNWEPLKNSLKCGGTGSKILVTTRNERVAIMMGTATNEIHHLGRLSHDECWLLLGRIAISGKNKEECEKFQIIGKDIANKCDGLPLAAKTLGSLLRFKNTLKEWDNVLNSEIWELEEVEVELFPHLLLSYNELSPPLKCCFSYCAVYPKDSRIVVEKLITEWMALGYLGSNESAGDDWEFKGREYFDKLAMRSLFQDFRKGGDLDVQIISFTMHDILHDFGQFIRKNGGEGARMKKTACQTCSPLLVSHVREYRSLFYHKEPPPHLCDCLTSLRLLGLRNCGLRSIPKEIEKLIHLRWLDLGCNKFSCKDLKSICKLHKLQLLWVDNCELQKIPLEIGNLIHLKHLNLSWNAPLKELPESLCDLRELESLNIDGCWRFYRLPRGIQRLINLKHLRNAYTETQFPEGLAQLTSLRTLGQFCEGRYGSKLGWLKNLNRLSGSLRLLIGLIGDPEEVIEDARQSELGKKMHIQKLRIDLRSCAVEDESVLIDVLDVLEPHPNLHNLVIWYYKGSRLPRWMASPLNQLRSIEIFSCEHLLSLPPLGKLPFLENFEIYTIYGLEFVGREFLGIITTTRGGGGDDIHMDIHGASSSSSSSSLSVVGAGTNAIGFPKLKTLSFNYCPGWKEWEDITTAEEEDSALVSLMPCLKELYITKCTSLTKLPHRLLRKASSLQMLDISESTQLIQAYGDKEGQAWKSISHHNPHLRLRN